MVRYELPRLPYGYGELEPFLGADALELHHLSHHKYYTDGLNAALASLGGASHPKHISSILAEPRLIPAGARAGLEFFGGGFENHRIFWESLSPGGGSPGGRLADALEVYFGGLDGFAGEFAAAALAIEGSGWCWLAFDPRYSRLEVLATAGECSPWTLHKVPLLGLDMWEHAHYMGYGHRREDYVSAWWGVANWDGAEGRYSGLA